MPYESLHICDSLVSTPIQIWLRLFISALFDLSSGSTPADVDWWFFKFRWVVLRRIGEAGSASDVLLSRKHLVPTWDPFWPLTMFHFILVLARWRKFSHRHTVPTQVQLSFRNDAPVFNVSCVGRPQYERFGLPVLEKLLVDTLSWLPLAGTFSCTCVIVIAIAKGLRKQDPERSSCDYITQVWSSAKNSFFFIIL